MPRKWHVRCETREKATLTEYAEGEPYLLSFYGSQTVFVQIIINGAISVKNTSCSLKKGIANKSLLKPLKNKFKFRPQPLISPSEIRSFKACFIAFSFCFTCISIGMSILYRSALVDLLLGYNGSAH